MKQEICFADNKKACFDVSEGMTAQEITQAAANAINLNKEIPARGEVEGDVLNVIFDQFPPTTVEVENG